MVYKKHWRGGLHRDPATLASASPIPDSSVIIVEAYGSTPQEAVDIANTGSDALVQTVDNLLDSQQAIGAVQDRLRDVLVEFNNARAALGPNEDSVTPDALRHKADVQSAQARVDGLIAQLNKLIGDSDQANGVQRLASGSVTSSNGVQRYEFGGLVGLIVGGVIAVVVAFRQSGTPGRRWVGNVPDFEDQAHPPNSDSAQPNSLIDLQPSPRAGLV